MVEPVRTIQRASSAIGETAQHYLRDLLLVSALLEEHDGQMRQSNIVEATDWSKAKVSRLLGDMADNGEIVKIPMGRQNLVCLDGMEPEIAKPLR